MLHMAAMVCWDLGGQMRGSAVVSVIYKREANDMRARGRGVVVPQARYYTRWKVWMSLGIDPEVQVLQHRSATHWQR